MLFWPKTPVHHRDPDSSECKILQLSTNLKLLVVPGDDCGAAELAVHAEGAHLPLQSVPQLLPRLQVPDEVGPCMVKLES